MLLLNKNLAAFAVAVFGRRSSTYTVTTTNINNDNHQLVSSCLDHNAVGLVPVVSAPTPMPAPVLIASRNDNNNNIGMIDRRRALCSSTQLAILSSLALMTSGVVVVSPATVNAATTTTSLVPRDESLNFPRKQPGLTIGDVSQSGIVCEVFVDFACPYSRKMFLTLANENDNVMNKYTDKMAFTFHNVLQPWHHQSLWLHESSFAIKLLYPQHELAYWTALFKDAPTYWYDKEVYEYTRTEFYNKIALFAANVVVAAETTKASTNNNNNNNNNDNNNNNNSDVEVIKSRILQYLIPPLQKGGNFPKEASHLLGSKPDDDENALFPMSRQVVKFQRRRGVHVTPTVFVNGIEQSQISSTWSSKEWTQFLNKATSSLL